MADRCCPSCGADLPCSTAVDGEAQPSPGDVSVCMYCCAPLVFTEGLGLRLLAVDEVRGLPRETRSLLARTIAAVDQLAGPKVRA